MLFWQIAAICEKYGVTLKTPIKDIPQEAIEEIMYGTAERLKIKKTNLWGGIQITWFPTKGLSNILRCSRMKMHRQQLRNGPGSLSPPRYAPPSATANV